MRTDRPARFLAKIQEKVLIQSHTPSFRIAIDLDQPRPLLRHLGIEGIVPGAVERVGDVEPPSIQAEL